MANGMKNVIKYIDDMKATEERFIDDINSLIDSNRDYLNKKSLSFQTRQEQINTFGFYLFEMVMHILIFQYEQTDCNKCAILNVVQKEYACYLDKDYVEKLNSKIRKYFDDFSLPKLNLSDTRDKQINDILNLSDNNKYKIKLYSILLEDCYNSIPEIQKYNAINGVLTDYYFNVVMVEEDKALKEQHEKQKQEEAKKNRVLINSDRNSIPDLSNLYEGKIYKSQYPVAEMIRDCGWKPKPAGKGSRTSQENRLRKFFDWSVTDTATNQKVIIETIYDEMISKPKLYEKLIEIPLLFTLLNSDNETLFTTRKRFFSDIGIISPYFDKLPIRYYKETLPETLIDCDSEIAFTRKVFYESVYELLRKHLFETLDSLQKRKKIRYSTSTIVVKGKQRIVVSELPTEEQIKIDKQILEANDYALHNVYYYANNQRKLCLTWENIIRNGKRQEFDRLYKDYINTQFGWSYTYEEIRITAGTKKSIEQSINEAQQQLKDKIIDYLKKHCRTKLKNRDEKINSECEELTEHIESIGYSKSYYQEEFDKIEEEKFPKFFIDIFDIMVDTEIDTNPEIQEQVSQWLDDWETRRLTAGKASRADNTETTIDLSFVDEIFANQQKINN